jgi:hypothetical protein
MSKSWRDILPIHPAADLFPLLGDDELRELADDIKANDLHEKVKIIERPRRRPDAGTSNLEDFEQVVLDGRNRLDAMELAGLPIFSRDTTEIDPELIEVVSPETDPVAYVIGVNIRRRHLTGEQKRNLVAQLLKTNPERSNLQTAKIVGVDDKTVASVRRKMEARSEIPNVAKTVDTKGRKQPTSKPKSVSEIKPKSVSETMPDLPGESEAPAARKTVEAYCAMSGRISAARSTLSPAEKATLECVVQLVWDLTSGDDVADNSASLLVLLGQLLATVNRNDSWPSWPTMSKAAQKRAQKAIADLQITIGTLREEYQKAMPKSKVAAPPPEVKRDDVMPDIPAYIDRRAQQAKAEAAG